MDNSKKTILEALEIHKGIVSAACKSVGMPRSTFYKWLSEDKEFKAQVDDIQEFAIDYVESKLFQKIEGVTVKAKGGTGNEDEPPVYELPPSDTAIIFYLKTKGKKRGYIERVEQDNRNSNYNAEVTPERLKEINQALENEL
jgi:hypothetical protein